MLGKWKKLGNNMCLTDSYWPGSNDPGTDFSLILSLSLRLEGFHFLIFSLPLSTNLALSKNRPPSLKFKSTTSKKVFSCVRVKGKELIFSQERVSDRQIMPETDKRKKRGGHGEQIIEFCEAPRRNAKGRLPLPISGLCKIIEVA